MTNRLVLGIGLTLSLAACGPDNPPANPTTPTATTPAMTRQLDAPPTVAGAPAVPPPVAPPKDARYTIFCLSVTGPNHTERAIQAKTLWQQATGRRDWYVIHQEDQSTLYFGYYGAINDQHSKETARAVADRAMIQTLKDNIGDQPFAHAMLLPLDAPDPTAPPEWNLVNSKGAWSVEIASFRGSPDRKSAAVESVRAARAQGIEAYYYNGDAVSSVCVGSWPRSAIEEPSGNDTRIANPEQNLMIVPEQLALTMPQSGTDKQGTETQILHNENKVVDPTLLATLRQFPVHSLNGNEDNVVEGGKLRPRPSFIVEVPHDQSVDVGSSASAPRVNLLGGASGNGDDGSTPATKLRSIGQ